jgi:Rrf2 family protein
MLLYSSACRYAISALTELAGQTGGAGAGYRQLRDISHGAGDIPPAFLGKILQDLVRAGLLRSSKGPRGGYRLAQRPEAITLLAIRDAIDGTADLDACASGLGRCSDDMPCPQHEQFKPLRVAIKKYLAQTTLANMAQALAEKRVLLAAQARRRTGGGPARASGGLDAAAVVSQVFG